MVRRVSSGDQRPLPPPSADSKEIQTPEAPAREATASAAALAAVLGPSTRGDRVRGPSYRGIVGLLSGRREDPARGYTTAMRAVRQALSANADAKEIQPLLQAACDHADWSQPVHTKEILSAFQRVAWPEGAPLAARYPLPYLDHLLEVDPETFAAVTRGTEDPELLDHLVARLADAPPPVALARGQQVASVGRPSYGRSNMDGPPTVDGLYAPLFARALDALDLSTRVGAMEAVGLAKALGIAFRAEHLPAIGEVDPAYFAACVRATADAPELDALVRDFLAADPSRLGHFVARGAPAAVRRALVARVDDLDFTDVDALSAFVTSLASLQPYDALAAPLRAGFAQTIVATPPEAPGFVALCAVAERHAEAWGLPRPTTPDAMSMSLAKALIDDYTTRPTAEAAMMRRLEAAPTNEALGALLLDVAKHLKGSFKLRSEGIDLLASRTDWSDPAAVAFLLDTRAKVDAGLVHEWFEAAAPTVAQAADLFVAIDAYPVLRQLEYKLQKVFQDARPEDAEALRAAVERAPAAKKPPIFEALCVASRGADLDRVIAIAQRHGLEVPARAAPALLAGAWDDPKALRARLDAILLRDDVLAPVLDAALERLGALVEPHDDDTVRFLWAERRDSPDGRSSTFPPKLIGRAFDLEHDLAHWDEAIDLLGYTPFNAATATAMQDALRATDDVAHVEAIADKVADSRAAAIRGPVFERFAALVEPSAPGALGRVKAMAQQLHTRMSEAVVDRFLAGPPGAVIEAAVQLFDDFTVRPKAELALVEALRTGTLSERIARLDRARSSISGSLKFLRPIFDALRAEIHDPSAHPSFQGFAWDLAQWDPSVDLGFDAIVPLFGETRVLDGLTGDHDADLKRAITEVPSGLKRTSLVAQHRLRHLLMDPNVDEYRLERDLQTVARAMVTSWRSSGRRGSSQKRLSPADEAAFVANVYQPAYDRLCGQIDWADDGRVKAVLGGIDKLAQQKIQIELAPEHLEDLFGHGRDTDLARAALLKSHKNDAIRARAEQAWSELERDTSLSDALLLVNAPNNEVRRLAEDVLARGFTADELRAALDDPSLDFDGLAARVQSATQRILHKDRTPETEAMVAEAIAPAYERLCNENDFTDSAKTQPLAQLPIAYAAKGHTLEFPARHAAALHANAPNPRELILHPSAAVRALEIDAVRARFTAAATLDQRRQVYSELTATLARAPRPPAPASKDRAAWQEALGRAVDALDGDVQTLKDELLVALLGEARALGDRAATLAEIQRLLPASVERDAELDALVADGWNDRATLDAVHHYGASNFTTESAQLLVETIGTFPGDVAEFVGFLRGEGSTADLITDARLAPEDAPHLERLRAIYGGFAPSTQSRIVTAAVDKLLTLVERGDPNVERVARDRGFASARALVDHVLDEKAFSAIAADPDGKEIIGDVRTVLDALPVSIRARIFTTVLLDPPTQDAPTLLKRIMVAAGAVAIKVGQQLSEDPAVPKRFRDALEDVRDQNQRMTPLGVWARVPTAQRAKIAALGPTLGTGSIKQVLLVRPDPSLGIAEDVEVVAAVVRQGVDEDITGSVAALDVLPHLRHVGRRVKPMLERELDLPREARAFEELERSAVGQLEIVAVPQVVAADHHFLMRRSTGGRTIAQITRARPLDAAERARIEQLHTYLVRAALDTRSDFMQDGKTFVLTDPHDANVSDDGLLLGLFDPGQFENLTPEEGDLFVRLLAAFSRDKWQRARKDKLVAQLMRHCEVGDPNDGKNQSLEQRLVAAYDGLTTGSVSAKLEAFFLDASKNGVAIPNSYFGVAKMLNTLTAREKERALAPVTEGVIKDLFLDQQGPFGRVLKVFT